LLNVFQGNTRFAVIVEIKAAAVVHNNDLTAGICFSCLNGNVKLTGIRISAVFDGIFHDGLEGQRRHTKQDVRRVIIDNQAVLVLGLLHGEVGAGVVQFRRKRDRRSACDGGEIFTQVGSEIHNDLPGLLRILPAEAVDARHGVVDEVRPHLQDHNAGTLMGNLPLLAQIPLDLIGQDEAVHRQDGEDETDVEEREDIDEHLHEQRDRHRQRGDEETEEGFVGKPRSPSHRTREIEQQDRDQRQQPKRVQGLAAKLPVRRDMVITADERGGACKLDKIDCPQAKHGVKELTPAYVFSAAVQQIHRQHRQRQRKEQRFQRQHEIDCLVRDGIVIEDRFKEAGKATQHKSDKIAQEEAFAPAVDPRHDGGDPPSQHTQQQCRAEHGGIENIDPIVHSPVPPIENGYRSFFSCSFTPSGVRGLRIKPLASVFHASRE